MNIFVLSFDPVEAATMLCDKHVQKMYIESAQVLSSALWLCGYQGVAYDAKQWKDSWHWPARASVTRAYSPTHLGHPCTLWAKKKTNYMWLIKHAIAICDEFEFRFGTVPATKRVIEQLPTFEVDNEPENYVLCMPEQYRSGNAVDSYRSFYRFEKSAFATWNRGRSAPDWYEPKTGPG